MNREELFETVQAALIHGHKGAQAKLLQAIADGSVTVEHTKEGYLLKVNG